MDEFKVKNITIQSSDSSLTISDDSRPGNSIVIDTKSLPEIIRILSRYRPNHAENRNGFRVPIGSLCETTRSNFGVNIEYAGESIEVTAINVSITGILVDHPKLRLPVDGKASIILRYQDNIATIKAIVVRCGGTRISFHFPETLSDGELDPPESIMKVYRALELDWLRERLP